MVPDRYIKEAERVSRERRYREIREMLSREYERIAEKSRNLLRMQVSGLNRIRGKFGEN